MSVLNSYLEKIAEGEASPEAATPSKFRKAVDYVKDKAGKGYGYVKDKGGLAVQYAKDNPYKTGGGALALAGGIYGLKKLKDRMSEKQASLNFDDAYELGFYDAIEKIAEGEATAEAATPSRYRRTVDYVKDKAGKGYGYVKDKGGLAVQYAKDNPYKTGGGALALAGAAYGAKKLKDRMSEKKASLDLDDAYELGFYDAIEKIAKKEEEGRGSRYSRIGGGLALPIAGIYGGGRLAEHLAATHGEKITNETLRKALPHAKNIGRGVGGVAGLGAAYGLHKALEKKSAYEEATLDKVAMWMDAGY